MQAGTMLGEEARRYPFFMVVWLLQFFVSGCCWPRSTPACAWRGARARHSGQGRPDRWLPGGFPVNFYLATWAPMSRGIPAGWLLELLVGAVLATLVAGWFYREG